MSIGRKNQFLAICSIALRVIDQGIHCSKHEFLRHPQLGNCSGPAFELFEELGCQTLIDLDGLLLQASEFNQDLLSRFMKTLTN